MEMVRLFKFLKTKKGFSLVELMIVVVIMAILVAVAVPIFNSVTGNAREKTCLDNQRQILGAVDNFFAMQGVSGTEGKEAKITFGYNGDDTPEILEDSEKPLSALCGDSVTLDDIKGLFKTIPVCGSDEETITLIIKANPAAFATSFVECTNDDHVLIETE